MPSPAEFFERLDVEAAPRALVALGGTRDPPTLVAAYRAGCFPWPSTGPHERSLERQARRLIRSGEVPLLDGTDGLVPWCSPQPRAVLLPVGGRGQPLTPQDAAPQRLDSHCGRRLRRGRVRLRGPGGGHLDHRPDATGLLRAAPRKPRTVALYRSMLGSWLAPWADRPIVSLTYDDVEDLVTRMREAGRSAQTILNVFTVANGVLKYAVKAGHLSTNPAAYVREDLEKRDDRAERVPATIEQVQALAALLPPMCGLVVRFAAMSGLRAGEIAGLRVRRVNVLRNEVQVEETVDRLGGALVPGTPKSARSRRRLPIPPFIAREVAAHIVARSLGPDDYVLGGDAGEPLNHAGTMYRRYFVPAREKIGRPDLRFHDLRHTYASLMAGGADLQVVCRYFSVVAMLR